MAGRVGRELQRDLFRADCVFMARIPFMNRTSHMEI